MNPNIAILDLHTSTIDAITSEVIGDKVDSVFPYLRFRDIQDQLLASGVQSDHTGYSSRFGYLSTTLRNINKTAAFAKFLGNICHPANFHLSSSDREQAVESLNNLLKIDGWYATSVGSSLSIAQTSSDQIDIDGYLGQIDNSTNLISSYNKKMKQRLTSEDYEGVITCARSLTEACLLAVHKRIHGIDRKYNGKIKQLFGDVRKSLGMDPSQAEMPPSLRNIISGLITTLDGLAELSEAMSDRHPRKFNPSKHHAEMARNASLTVCNFISESLDYQANSGRIQIIASGE